MKSAIKARGLMILLCQQLFNGIFLGSYYGLMAVGLNIIFGILGVVNFAHGQFFIYGAIIVYLASLVGVPYLIGVILAAILVATLGVIVEKTAVHSLLEKKWWLPIISTLAVFIILSNSAIVFFGASPKAISSPFAGKMIEVSEVYMDGQRILVIIMALLSFFALHLFVKYTKHGKAMRAVSQDKRTARLLGIDIHKISALAFLIGGALSGFAGALITPIYSLNIEGNFTVLLKIFAVIIMGGLGSVKGALYGAYILGIGESIFQGYISGTWSYTFAFVLIILVLVFKPQGLYGKQVGI